MRPLLASWGESFMLWPAERPSGSEACMPNTTVRMEGSFASFASTPWNQVICAASNMSAEALSMLMKSTPRSIQ